MNHIQHVVRTLFPQIQVRYPELAFIHAYRADQLIDVDITDLFLNTLAHMTPAERVRLLEIEE